jgi:flavin-dependent dehydrogenase
VASCKSPALLDYVMTHPMETPAALVPATGFECDVLVIGGGPGGSTIGALLAERGRDVVVLEKEHHPRFHIGESLLPANVSLFDRLGLRAELERIGMRKWGAEFVSPEHEQTSSFEFADAWDKTMPYAWQVRRSELDELLFRHAAKRGARTFEGCRARQVAFDAEGATVQVEAQGGAAQTWRTRFLVDASGRDTMLANHFKCKQKNPSHSSSAIYAHFTGVERLVGKLEGNISIFWFAHGWFWFIPLADGVTSIGAVCWPYYLKSRSKPVDEFFADTIALCPALARRVANAERVSEVHATGNYSYSSSISCGERYLMLGDAYAFIDPVFSSGVLLAMQSGFAGVDVVETTLDRPKAAPAARRWFDKRMRRGPREFSWFIFRVTNPTMREFFMEPGNPLRVKEALLSLLAGDIYGKTPIWPSIFAFKALYYLASIGNFGRTFRTWKRHRANIRDVEVPSS